MLKINRKGVCMFTAEKERFAMGKLERVGIFFRNYFLVSD